MDAAFWNLNIEEWVLGVTLCKKKLKKNIEVWPSNKPSFFYDKGNSPGEGGEATRGQLVVFIYAD